MMAEQLSLVCIRMCSVYVIYNRPLIILMLFKLYKKKLVNDSSCFNGIVERTLYLGCGLCQRWVIFLTIILYFMNVDIFQKNILKTR